MEGVMMGEQGRGDSELEEGGGSLTLYQPMTHI